MTLPPYLAQPAAIPSIDRGDMEATTALLADTWRDPVARARFNEHLDTDQSGGGVSRSSSFGDFYMDDLIVGGGLHAAVYAATAQARTGVRPAVAEGRRMGGVFALCDDPVFYLNSRNRPGDLGLPGTSAALNVIPNGMIQPSDLNGSEYQTNVEFAFAIRANLAMYADMLPLSSVRRIERNYSTPADREYYVAANGLQARANRIIIATGVGRPTLGLASMAQQEGGTFIQQPGVVMSFEEFVRYVGAGDPFPLRGWKNVAVVGAKDSGDAIVKYLLGQGPMAPSPASLDTVERIDWYGQQCLFKEEFDQGARSCNAGIGRHLPRTSDTTYPYRVRPKPQRVSEVLPDHDSARVVYGSDHLLSDPYDHIVVCAGYKQSPIDLNPDVDRTLTDNEVRRGVPLREEIVYDDDGTALARHYVGTEIYKVGPCADLPVTDAERATIPAAARIPANSAAAWRYVGRTQRLAEILNPA